MKADKVTEKEVMAVLNKFAESYSKRDLEGLMSLIASDADGVLIGIGSDEKRVGLDEMKIQFEHDWSEFEAASIIFNRVSISAAGAVAWVAADTLFKMTIEGQDLIFPCYHTNVLEKRGDKWFIVQTHYSVPFEERPHSDAKQHLSQL